MKALIGLAALLPALAACVDSSANQKTDAVEKAVEYIGGFAEYRIENGNHIWMKFKVDALPSDHAEIVRGAALKAHQAHGSGAHVYLLAHQSKLSEIPAVRLICSATARYGKVEKSDC